MKQKIEKRSQNMISSVLAANDRATLTKQQLEHLGEATFTDLLSFGFTVEQCERIFQYAKIEAARCRHQEITFKNEKEKK